MMLSMAKDNIQTVTTSASSGIGLSTVLFVVFLTLQLCHVIDWPWYAIAAPLLISWGLGLIFILITLIIVALAS